MVVLITGPSHVGKTLLAQRMLETHGWPYLSIDHLKMGLIRSGCTDLTPEDDAALTGYLWPIVREIVKTAIENRQNLIVEGCYIPFDWRQDFDESYLAFIRFLCLTMTEGFLETHWKDVMAHSCDIESRLEDSDCSLDWLKRENRFYAEGFRKAGESVVQIDADYEKTVRALAEEG